MGVEEIDSHDQQPFKAVPENDMKALAATGTAGLVELAIATRAGMTTEEPYSRLIPPHVMQVDVRQQGRDDRPLRSSYFRLRPFAALGYPAFNAGRSKPKVHALAERQRNLGWKRPGERRRFSLSGCALGERLRPDIAPFSRVNASFV
jgi:hypothetical protein